MQSMENDEAVSHPSHSRLEDADEARVSHIPTTTAARLDKKDKQLRLLYQSIGLFSLPENAGRIASENAIYEDLETRRPLLSQHSPHGFTKT
jgi:hypothetical protein